ncbi:MAG TPA: hypothetical protein VE078_00900 [Thermoanaerobaculia bacterium]|nr:hypothetical protein [Thermoanaerobaculia bacterium]
MRSSTSSVFQGQTYTPESALAGSRVGGHPLRMGGSQGVGAGGDRHRERAGAGDHRARGRLAAGSDHLAAHLGAGQRRDLLHAGERRRQGTREPGGASDDEGESATDEAVVTSRRHGFPPRAWRCGNSIAIRRVAGAFAEPEPPPRKATVLGSELARVARRLEVLTVPLEKVTDSMRLVPIAGGRGVW